MIAVTGVGVISALGIGKEEFLSNLLDGRSGYGEPELFDFGIGPVGEIKGFSAKEFIPAMLVRRMGRFSQLALVSCIEAVQDSGIEREKLNCFRTAVCLGTGLGGTGSNEAFYTGFMKNGPRDANPMLFPETIPNIAAGHIAMHFGIKGPNVTFSHNEISSELALRYALGLLESNAIDVALVTCADELSGIALRGFSALGMLTGLGMRTFEDDADGFVLSEGGATLVLERVADARERGAEIYAGIASVEFASEPVGRLRYDVSGRSMTSSMRKSLERVSLDSVDVISASACSVPEHDRAEMSAIRETFQGDVPVVAIRAYTGYFVSDSLLRLAATILCMESGRIPGRGTFEHSIESALSNSFAAGGTASSVVVMKI